jgi:GDP-4-dehydro-6-deoxy-D-mannose reductase
VDDVLDGYLALLRDGVAGEAYNIASGRPVRLADLLTRLMVVAGVDVIPETDPALLRTQDIAHLVGDAGKLRSRTGWTPQRTLDQALAEVVGAPAD